MPNVSPIESILTFAYGVVVLLALALLMYALIVLVARVLHRFMSASPVGRDPALDALRTRLASGEIDEVEYRHLRSVLHGS
jgi:uncharacterized membrane protein